MLHLLLLPDAQTINQLLVFMDVSHMMKSTNENPLPLRPNVFWLFTLFTENQLLIVKKIVQEVHQKNSQ